MDHFLTCCKQVYINSSYWVYFDNHHKTMFSGLMNYCMEITRKGSVLKIMSRKFPRQFRAKTTVFSVKVTAEDRSATNRK